MAGDNTWTCIVSNVVRGEVYAIEENITFVVGKSRSNNLTGLYINKYVKRCYRINQVLLFSISYTTTLTSNNVCAYQRDGFYKYWYCQCILYLHRFTCNTFRFYLFLDSPTIAPGKHLSFLLHKLQNKSIALNQLIYNNTFMNNVNKYECIIFRKNF